MNWGHALSWSGVVVAAAFATAVITLGVLNGWDDVAAAWVQVGGTFLALAIAIGLPIRAERQARSTFRATVLSHATMMRDGVVAAAIFDGTYDEMAYRLPLQQAAIEINLPRLLRIVEALPLVRLESAEAAETLMRLMGAVDTFTVEINRPRTGIDQAVEDLVNGYTPRRYAADQVKLRHDELAKLIG